MNYLATYVYLAMAARKRRSVLHEEDINEPRDAAPNICSLPIEGISPTLDPNRVLLRRVFFLNEDRKKYVYVAFYPAQGYTAHVEFGTAKAAPLKLTQQQFTMLNEHLPGLIGPYVLTTIIIQASMTVPG